MSTRTSAACHAALNRLAKWRNVLAGWQLGTRLKGDPEGDAVRDHREGSLLLRAELSAITTLLIAKGVITHAEFECQLLEEAGHLNKMMEARFPGFTTSEAGVHIDPKVAVETTRGWIP